MIELRRKIELAIAHPLLGPVVIVALALLLALVLLHAVQDESGMSLADIGLICIAIAGLLAGVVTGRTADGAPILAGGAPLGRAPPRLFEHVRSPCGSPASELVLPLRR